MGNPYQNYAAMMSMVKEHREGKRPITAASEGVRKKVVSETPKDEGERTPPKTTESHDPTRAS